MTDREPADESPDPERTRSAAATMRDARERIDDLAAREERFAVACRASGVSPVPLAGVTFGTYADAERALAAAREYRRALMRLDPAVTGYELAVCERAEDAIELASVRERTAERRPNGLPRARQTVTVAGNGTEEWLRVENGPVVHFRGPDTQLDDEVVARQLDAKLR